MSHVQLEQVGKTFLREGQAAVHAVQDVSLDVAAGEYLTLVGPSGGGKTTLLRLVAGLEHPDRGTIRIAGRVVNGVEPKARDVAMVFQSQALYPHLTVGENLALGLRLRRRPAAVVADRLRDVADALALGALWERLPEQLSGGQRQRVALGRALAVQPQLLLLDEPLSGLDAPQRTEMRRLLRRLDGARPTTIVHVAHDPAEALALGDRVAVLRAGRLLQVAEPAALYAQPAHAFVAGFLGAPPMNLFRAALAPCSGGGHRLVVPEAGDAELSVQEIPAVVRRLAAGGSAAVRVGIRPEHLRRASPEKGGGERGVSPALGRIETMVEATEFRGADTLVHLRWGRIALTMSAAGAMRVPAGERCMVEVDPARLHWFDLETERALR